jgi:TonB-dependent starch-binding outer membrane protein SusC
MKRILQYIFLPLFLAIITVQVQGNSPVLQAQSENERTGTITGTIRDKRSGGPLFGATIGVSGTSIGVVTDEKGSYVLRNVPANRRVRLRVNYVGYKTINRDVFLVENTNLDFSLDEDILGLDEISVTGYVQTKRNARTSAIATVESGELKSIAASSIGEQVQGQVSGLQISSTYGVPGSALLVRLRGTTSINAGNNPLFVVDGVFINNQSLQALQVGGQTTNPLSDINPADIESIEILKDANATAIFGARGANGVIIITTKRGQKDSKTKVNFNAEYGVSNIVKLWELASGPDHATIINEAWVNDGKPFATRPYRPASEVVNGAPGLGTPESQGTYDRLSPLLRTAQQQTYNLSVSGGDTKTTYYLGLNYTFQEATLKLMDFERLGIRINVDHNISKNLLIGVSNSYSKTKRELVRAGDTGGILNTGIQDASLLPIFNEDGSYANDGRFNNPYVLLENNHHYAYGKHLISNTYLRWNILNNLTFKSSWSLDDNDYYETVYYNARRREGVSPNGSGSDVTTIKQTWSAEQLFNYHTNIGDKHFVALFAGNTVEKTEFSRVTASGSNYPSPEFTKIISAAITSGSSTGTSSALLSWFGGANYSFDNKYSADLNIRSDASSRFGANNRWATFPSGGLSWRVSEESFFRNHIGIVNELKLKTSIGWTGNQDIDDFASLGLWEGGQNYLASPGISPFQLGNKDLKWETTRQFNAGIESSLIDNRLTIEFNYYDKKTVDLLLNVPAPIKTGFASTLQNLGEMSNKGFELEISSVNIKKSRFGWNTTFNLTHNKNEITKLESSFSQYNRNWVRLEEGYPIYSFWLYKQLHVDPQTGNAVYEDVTKDGRITSDDRQIVGNAWPKFYGGLKNSFTLRNFDLSAFVYFSYGNKVLNMNRYFQENGGQRGINWSMSNSMMDRWQNPGDITDIPRSYTLANPDGSFNHNFESSRFMEDGSFVRLRNVSLGYNLPKKSLSGTGISNARVYINATNLYTLTNYSGPDPEVNTAANFSNGTVQGLDFSVPPQPRTFIFGVNVTF